GAVLPQVVAAPRGAGGREQRPDRDQRRRAVTGQRHPERRTERDHLIRTAGTSSSGDASSHWWPFEQLRSAPPRDQSSITTHPPRATSPRSTASQSSGPGKP